MSAEFGSNLGLSSAGRVDLGSIALPTKLTHFVWVMRLGEGGSAFGRVLGRGAGVHDICNDHGSFANNYAFGDRAGGQYHRWTRTDNVGDWSSILISGDTSTTAVPPRVVQDNKVMSLTRIGAANFWGTTTSTATVIGNRQSDNSRVWDGYIAHYCLWDDILNEWEEEQLNNGVAPYLVRPQNIVRYYPLDSDNNLYGVNANIINARYAFINPPVIDGSYDANVYYLNQSASNDTSLASAATVQLSSTASLTSSILLSGTSTASLSSVGVLSTSISLVSSAPFSVTAAANLQTSIGLSAAATCSFSASASLSSGSGLFSDAACGVVASASLTTGISLLSSATSTLTVLGSLNAGANLSANATCSVTASASISAGVLLSSNSACSIVSVADINALIRFNSNNIISLSANGLLANFSAQFSSNTNISLNSSANLLTGIRLIASNIAVATSNASLTTSVTYTDAPFGPGYPITRKAITRPENKGRSRQLNTANRVR